MSYSGALVRKQGGKASEVPLGKTLDVKGTLLGAMRVAEVPLVPVTGTTPGGALSWANPEGRSILLFSPVVRIKTPSTGAASVDGGVAANGATSSDTLFDGLDVNAAAGVFDAPSGAGANDAAMRVMTATQFLTFTASASLAGLVGSVIIPYIVLAD